MYVGFSAATSPVERGTSHFILGWSFRMNGVAQALDLSRLPKLPRRKWKFAEVLEEWELAYGPHRFKYQDLCIATNGFTEKQLLGKGGFGRFYKGVLPTNNLEVAVKKVSYHARQGMRAFVAEIVSIGRLSHGNLAPLLGYCRRKEELLLVYEFMSNGSLDKFLYDQPKYTLHWSQRFHVIKGVASGLFYLHEEWEQVVIHRDVKASNVLLDGELNGRLGDFGPARLYDHGTLPQTTHAVGQGRPQRALMYMLLGVTCGRRPIEPRAAPAENFILVDWVFSCWKAGNVLQAVDQRLRTEYVKEEAELVLKLASCALIQKRRVGQV
ncbi:L-type lectin-domain containing receptor kinase IV.1-like [Coffea arabica]|uniref:L-type lectin-domain containing receptor kinase IV.1-like n=1 Tax=Coffea arabica TaxID=13443 RepID=A0ABM4X7I9_COFAR